MAIRDGILTPAQAELFQAVRLKVGLHQTQPSFLNFLKRARIPTAQAEFFKLYGWKIEGTQPSLVHKRAGYHVVACLRFCYGFLHCMDNVAG